jgi:hypothetical protein
MVRYFIIIFSGFCGLLVAQTANDDGNVTIQSKHEVYEYKMGANKTPVVDMKISTRFLCNKFRTIIPFVESYTDKTTINDVSIFVDGKRNKRIKPEYTYYSIENIFYSDARVCRFVLPLDRKGSISEVQIRKTCADPRYFTRVWLGNQYDTQVHHVEIIVPKWMKISIHEMNFNRQITRQTSYDALKNADIYRFTVIGADAWKDEDDAPGASYFVPHLLIHTQYADTPSGRQTYFPELKDMYEWYRSLAELVNNDEELMQTTAEKITKDCETDIDKMKAVYAWVQDNIRYIAFLDGIAGFKPDNAQDVMRKRYGDCKGMANLLKSLLKPLGFDARLCWMGTNHIVYDYSIPNLAVDNHMICAVLHEGKIYYLDATAKYLALEQYAEQIQGRQVMIENGDDYILEQIPSTTSLQNVHTEICQLEIEGTNLKGHAQNRFTGENKEYFLRSLHSIRRDKQEDVLTAYFSPGGDVFEMSNIQETGIKTSSPDVTIDFDFKLKNGARAFGDEWYIEIDFRKELLFFELDTAKRKMDCWFPYKSYIHQHTELILPEDVRVISLPEAVYIDRGSYRFDIFYQIKDNKVVYKKELILNDIVLPKSQFVQWNTDIRQLKKAYLEQIVLSKKEQP